MSWFWLSIFFMLGGVTDIRLVFNTLCVFFPLSSQLCKKKVNLAISLGDCTAEEVAEQFEDLNGLLVKMLNSAIVPARHIAQTAYMTIARTVYTSESAPARELLVASIRDLFTTYVTKKNTRIASKFIEDLVLNRLTDIAVPVVWKDLVTKVGASEHSFLRTEFTTIFASVLKKYLGLASEAQETVRTSFAAGLSALTAQLSAALADGADKQALSGKKIKPLLAAVKDVTDFLKKAVPAKEGSKDTKVVVFADLRAVRDSVEGLNATVEQLLVRTTVPKAESTETEMEVEGAEKAEKTEKGDKKGKKQNAQPQNSLAPVIKQIQANVGAFLTGTATLASAEKVTATPGKSKKSKAEPTTDKKAVPEATPKKVRSNSADESVASKAVSEKKRKVDVTESVEATTPAAKGDKAAVSAVKSEKKAKKDKK